MKGSLVMSRINLNGNWLLKDVNKTEWLEAAVPGTVFTALRNANLAPDPYYRDNEDAIQEIFTRDYEYFKEFQVESADLSNDEVMLVLEGIDTIGDIYINKKLVGNTENMHRTYKFDVRHYLVEGTNEIKVFLYSPKNYIKEKAAFSPMPSILGNTGVEQMRKAQCAFGWDWGLSLPDIGIWRSIYIECSSISIIEDFYITQSHNAESVTLQWDVELKTWTDKPMELHIEVKPPSGGIITAKCNVEPRADKASGTLEITNPMLWWPNGSGAQPLYEVRFVLSCDNQVLSAKEAKIGLRTITLRREDDEWGQCYEFVVNGKAIFMKGSNLIVEDAVLTGYSEERTEKMLKDCTKANFNCIRVWGGSLYPESYFFDICDRLGLVVYQDFMFACHTYPVTDEFLANVSEEIKDNVKRIRNHASLGLWSGNNEIETIIELYIGSDPMLADLSAAIRKAFNFEKPDARKEKQLKDDYLLLFDKVIPDLLSVLDPNTSYTRCSPCLKDKPFERDFNAGDTHYYINMAGMIPYRDQRQYYFRFVSEMGFQSYPSVKTINTFTLPEDRRPDSPVMYKHQKSGGGNQTIENYMGQEFKVPGDFGLYVYESQIIAGEIQKYAIEHMRRNRGRCMGVITWQLNDCWPVVSWAGLDYYGRWKAQQYYSKRFYAPILLSANEEGSKAGLYVTNDTFEPVSGTLYWALKDNSSNVIIDGNAEVTIAPLSAKNCAQLDFAELLDTFDPATSYLSFSLMRGANEISHGTATFVPAKDFKFLDPDISFTIEETNTAFEIRLTSKAYARFVALDLESEDCIFSDNFFDLSAGSDNRVITIEKTDITGELGLSGLESQLKILSVYDLQG
jgi:beta-mannosidase